jgi:hypothetical protein
MTFQADKARGALVEAVLIEYHTGRGWKAERIDVAEQLQGAGDLRLTCPVTLRASDLEVKASFGRNPHCLIELASYGGHALTRHSGLMSTTAEQIVFVRWVIREGYLFDVAELRSHLGEWTKAWNPRNLRDQGARTSRQVLPVPWTELARAGRTITLRQIEAAP